MFQCVLGCAEPCHKHYYWKKRLLHAGLSGRKSLQSQQPMGRHVQKFSCFLCIERDASLKLEGHFLIDASKAHKLGSAKLVRLQLSSIPVASHHAN